MMFWTKEQYLKFAEVMMDKPCPSMPLRCFTGVASGRGELLALTPADFDF